MHTKIIVASGIAVIATLSFAWPSIAVVNHASMKLLRVQDPTDRGRLI
jgi:hypothetical protein